MHPEQLEAIPGIGPKTMEKIFYTINNYFSSLEAAEGSETADVESAPPDQAEAAVSEEQTEPVTADQSGGDASLAEVPEPAPGSTDEPVASEQNLEASIISSGDENNSGVDNAPAAGEEKVNPEEKHPGEEPTTPEKQ
jgi:preprotein translocase subunit SecD